MDKTDDTDHRKPVTMRKVAETAGVSMATVSRVLNGSGPVNAQAAERVRAAIASLKYQPNRAARTLASSRSAFIGLLIADIQNPFFIELMCGIEEEVRQNRYLLIMCNNPPDPRTEEQRQYIEILAAAPVAGGPKSTSTANERVLGYRQALQEAGIKHDPVLEHRGPFTEETGQNATHSLLDLDPPVDAIFGTNNRLTIGALRTLYVRRKRVPDDIALVGFDMRGWANPDLLSITTVLQPAYELGRAAANRLIQRIRQPDAPKQEIILPYQLLIGESSHPRRQPGLIDGHWNAGGMLK
ncbi:MAG: LacI family transcriptional regulator [Chloroflexi bacterium]|nr:MAG: LacI family transcriptional regulator [Chloroflexota bacterium]